MIRKPDPPVSRFNTDTSEPGPKVSVNEYSSGHLPQFTTEDIEESMTVSAPGASTNVVSRPAGPSNQDIHQSIKDRTDITLVKNLTILLVDSDSETDGDNIIVNENKVVDDIVQNLGDKALDGLLMTSLVKMLMMRIRIRK